MLRIYFFVFFISVQLVFASYSYAQEIFINQAGYYPKHEKYALIENPANPDDIIYVIDIDSGKAVFESKMFFAVKDKYTAQNVGLFDFSALKNTGKYKIKYADKESYGFEVKKNIYQPALLAGMKTYYYQQCGKDNYTGNQPCHVNDAYIKRPDSFHKEGEFKDATGGWHDAGDYGKYIATTSLTASLLMSAFEQNPNIRELKYYKDESGLPDALREVKYALDWMLKMQREDGAVYRKCSGNKWIDKKTMPNKDNQKRFVFGVSTQETAKFAAVMAQAARTFKKYDPVYSAKCLKAAILSWDYLEKNSSYIDYKYSDDSGSGSYLYPEYKENIVYDDTGERLWASAELYLSTKKRKYLNYFADNFKKTNDVTFSWGQTSLLGKLALSNHKIKNKQLKKEIQKNITDIGDKIIEKMSDNPYFIPVYDITWGSNRDILDQGVILAHAYDLTGAEKYKVYALKTLNYIFGCNPNNKSYVTGIGTNPVKNLHNRYFMTTGGVISGYLAGGPNNYADDNIAKAGLELKSYIDDYGSYATNENAIDYNAALVFMLSWAESLGE